MNKVERFKKSIEGVKFTPAQKKIVSRILTGYEWRRDDVEGS